MAFSDLDLEFEDEDEAPKALPPKPEVTGTNSNIKKLETKTEAPKPQISGSSALKVQPKPVQEATDPDLREQMRKLQIDAEVKVQLAEFKTTYLADLLSDVKLVDHQIGQILNRINAKHPDSKNELLMIKKILADFIAKKRK